MGIMSPLSSLSPLRLFKKTASAIANSVDEKGRVLGVSEGTWPGTADYYKSLATGEWWWGTGAFLLAMSELHNLPDFSKTT
jgi:hypothetical protein